MTSTGPRSEAGAGRPRIYSSSEQALLGRSTAKTIRLRAKELAELSSGSIEVDVDSFVELPTPPPIPDEVESPDIGPASPHPWLADEGEIARGGMGRIHRIRHRPLGRHAVMKVLEPSKNRKAISEHRFVEEAQITGQLDHPNIPPVHDLWLAPDGTYRFSMKLVEGRTLTDLLLARPPRRRRDVHWEQLLDILLKSCDAVAFAHNRGVIHRDIKPDNIMVGGYGQVWVMDWGLAALLPTKLGEDDAVAVTRDIINEPLDPPDTILGTPAFMAPEQARGEIDKLDERTDVYLLGATLYAMLAHKPPHIGPGMTSVVRAQRGEVDPLDTESGHLPPELCRIALKALSASMDDRYPTVEALRQDLAQAQRRGLWYRSQSFPEGTLIVREGEQADSAYTIVEGACEVFRVESGERVVLRRLGPGDTFGETAIFTRQTRTASVQVVDGELVATVISREAFERALGDSWLRPFVMALASRFTDLDAQAAELRAQQSVSGD